MKPSKLRIDYKLVAILSGVRVIIASLPCLEYAHYHPIIGSFAYHYLVVRLSFVVTPGRHSLPLGGHAGVCLAGKTLTCLEYPRDARPIVLLP